MVVVARKESLWQIDPDLESYIINQALDMLDCDEAARITDDMRMCADEVEWNVAMARITSELTILDLVELAKLRNLCAVDLILDSDGYLRLDKNVS